MANLILLPLFFAVFYFLLIRPQQKRAKEHTDLVSSLEKGDDILTTGGLYGTIVNIDGQIAELEIADGVVVRIQRSAVAELIEWDTGDDPSRDEDQ
jgi:preprotein translocase subunit YajC